MSDLLDIIKQRQDELRGREENWIDRLGSWWGCVDGWLLAFQIVAIPHIAVLFLIEIAVVLEMFGWRILP